MARPRKTKQTPPDRSGQTEINLPLYLSPEEQEELNNAWKAFTRGKGDPLSAVLDEGSTIYSKTDDGEEPSMSYLQNKARIGDMLIKYFNLARRHELSTARRRYKKRRELWGLNKKDENKTIPSSSN